MIRRSTDRWDGVEPETLYLKRVMSQEELVFDWLLVHDLEDGCWYVVDPTIRVCCGKRRKRELRRKRPSTGRTASSP